MIINKFLLSLLVHYNLCNGKTQSNTGFHSKNLIVSLTKNLKWMNIMFNANITQFKLFNLSASSTDILGLQKFFKVLKLF